MLDGMPRDRSHALKAGVATGPRGGQPSAGEWLWHRKQLTKPKKDVKPRPLRRVCKRALYH